MRLQDIDKNFVINDHIQRDDIEWYDVRDERFALHGMCEERDATQAFHRMPTSVAEQTSPGVARLNFHTAGGRARFITDSPFIAILCEMDTPMELMSHMPLTGSQGFDLYIRGEDGVDVFCRSFFPPAQPGVCGFGGFQAVPEGRHAYTLGFPLYGTVRSLKIGLRIGSSLESAPAYEHPIPVIFYGSSITQGGCASRPGTSYEAFLSRRFGFDYVNLGFSGSARGEDAIVSYMAGLTMSAFVSDYDHNAPNLEHLQATLWPMYEKVRAVHPDIPFVFASSPGVNRGEARRQHIRSCYERALELGDTNVYYVDGGDMFAGPFADDCTMEGCHPNDLGFYRMYKAFAKVFENIYR